MHFTASFLLMPSSFWTLDDDTRQEKLQFVRPCHGIEGERTSFLGWKEVAWEQLQQTSQVFRINESSSVAEFDEEISSTTASTCQVLVVHK